MKTLIFTAAIGAALSLGVSTAQAADLHQIDRSAFDGHPVVTAAGWTMSAPTAGELGGWLQMSVQAQDGTLPVAGACETALVDAVLTTGPDETFTIHTTGDLCANFIDGTPSLFAPFGKKQMTYAGPQKKANLSGEGSISSANGAGAPGALGTVSLTVRW